VPLKKPWPYNHIKEPSPAEWPKDMTICVIGSCVETNSICWATDMKISMADMSADFAAIKVKRIGDHWIALYSGSDVSYVPTIVREVKGRCREDDSLDNVSAAFRQAIQNQLRVKIENEVLASLGYTLEDFRQNGFAQLGEQQFAQVLFDVKNQKMDVSFLVAGFDENTNPHILVVQSNGTISDYSELGFWAIGSGQTMALGFLFNLKRRPRFLSEIDTMYRICEAKFNAENAEGVGEETIAGILQKDGEMANFQLAEIRELRGLWKNSIAADPPEDIKTKVTSILDKMNKRIAAAKPASNAQKTESKS
jgi:hypothetical protein